jgi:tRNA nucleotidyltransferase (CCA-adding enzyme)
MAARALRVHPRVRYDAPVSVSTRHLARAIPDAVRTISRVLSEAGFRSWVVGGSVRDHLITELFPEREAHPKNDWDIATDARPEQVQKLFRRVIPTGIQHGTVTVVLAKQNFEVTTLRGETTYSDGRHPDEVYFVSDLDEDLARRDFTVNAIAYDALVDRLFDPFGGTLDLEKLCLRAVGNPLERFGEDGLRVLRCARFAATLEMNIAPETRAAMRPSLESYRKVSAERIRDEWLKALGAKRPSRAFEVMRDEGLLEVTAPELFALSEVRVEGLDVDVLTHSLLTVDALPADAEVRLAGLFHALGVMSDGEPRAEESSQKARALGMRLRLSNAERERVAALVRHQVLPDVVPEGGALRRYLRDVTPELLPDVLRLLRAHASAGQNATTEDLARLDALEARCKDEMSRVPPLSLKELAIGGRDLIAEAGITAGPEVGRTLNTLLEVVLDDPAENTRDALLARARALRNAP